MQLVVRTAVEVLGAMSLVLLAAAPARAQLDCGQCRAVCAQPSSGYPAGFALEGPGPTQPRADAAAAFAAARALDPAFGGDDLAGAVVGYKRATILDGDSAWYRNHLAGALIASGNVDEAVYNLQRAIALVPSDGKYLVNLGYAYHRQGDEVRALVYYQRGLMLDARDLRARTLTAFALDTLGYHSEALLEFKKVLLQDPRNAVALAAVARLQAQPFTAEQNAPPAPLTQTK